MGIVESALAFAGEVANRALTAAGDLAGDATDMAMDTANTALVQYQKAYQAYLATGMDPESAADAAERYMRDVYGIVAI